MIGVAALQRRFAAALLDPEIPPPVEAIVRQGGAVDRRFAVHRNNIAVSLVDALAERFAVTQRLVGEEFFRFMALVFVRTEPPDSPLLMTYGDGFARFIERFPPAANLPYLADIARLEAARTRAYHAPEALALRREELASLDPAGLSDLRFDLHPSVETLSSPWAIVTIWEQHGGANEPRPMDADMAEDALISRPDLEVEVRRLPAGGARFLSALATGARLGDACEQAQLASPLFDFVSGLAALISSGILVGVRTD